MSQGWIRAIRYARAWGTDPEQLHVDAVETTFDVSGIATPGTLYVPRSRPGTKLPAWVALHGVTVPGRRHESLVRFATAMASSGAVVFTPEIPAWSALDLDPEHSLPTIKGSILELREHPQVDPDRVGLVGFSFGAPQVLVASVSQELQGRLRAVACFGGYYDLDHTLRYLFSGHYEWAGQEQYQRTDPYGRWVVASNFLARVPGLEHTQDAAAALRDLAMLAGERRIRSWDPEYDPLKDRMCAALPEAQRHVFRLIAPPAAEAPDKEAGQDLAARMLAAVRHDAPMLDPMPWIERIHVPVHLVHGREDPTIPYSETLRMAPVLREHTAVRATVTRLLSHAGDGAPLGRLEWVGEQWRLARALAGVLGSV